jgi:2-oxoglutarate dehydrogenase E2 component (dihydrolipoamide succinyltransferase)
MAEITLPQLGETVTEGTITRWFKKIGDTVAADEPLFEVSTDKVDTEVPSPIAGVLTEIRVAEGDTVAVGTVIAVVGDASSAPAPAAAAPAAVAPASAATSAAPLAPASEPETRTSAKEPESVAPVAEAPVAPAPEPETRTSAKVSEPVPAHGASNASTSASLTGVVLSPVVRKLIAENGLDVSRIQGTGPGGRITRDDAMAAIGRQGSAPAAAPATTASAAPAAAPRGVAPRVVAGNRDEVVALSKIRQATGIHTLMSKDAIPAAFSVVEVDFANVDSTRLRLKEEFKATEGFSLTYLPFIARAVVDAIKEFPHMNSSVGESELIIHKYVDLGIAIDLDYQGLLAPVIRDADEKRLRAISREVNDLAVRARSRQLSPMEISGGTFTITNNGSSGSVLTMPIIIQPQVAILSTDAVKKKPVVIEIPGGGESIAIHPVGNLAMAWDHRAFDGAYAANFLVKVKTILETRDWSSEV